MTRVEAVCLGAFAVSVVVTPLAAWAARRTGIVDRPGSLKPQERSVPYLGGVGIFCGLLVGVAVSHPIYTIPLVLAIGLGTADDRLDLPPGLRLGGQIVVGVVTGLVVSTRFAEAVSVLLIAAVTVLLMNGVNLIDGLDSLAGGVGAVGAGGLAIMLHGDARDIGAALALSIAGFLVYNRPPAKVYMGDGGAYVLGTALALLLASGWAKGERVEVGISCLLVAAIPSAEVVLAITRRLKTRASLMAGDRGHPYDRLVQGGWPRPAAAAVYVVAEVVLVLIAVAVYRSHTSTAPIIAAALTAIAVLGLTVGTFLVTPRTPEPHEKGT